MDKLVIKAKTRVATGKGAARKLRRQGMVPAILYGPSIEPMPLVVSSQALEKILRLGKTTSFLDLEIEDNSPHRTKVIIKDMNIHPVTEKLLHIDFYEISMDKEITVEVPVVLVGKSKDLERRGILEQNKRVLTISCLPHLVPECIEIDVSKLDAGDSIYVKDISLKEGIRIIENPQIPVVTVILTEAEKEEGEEKET